MWLARRECTGILFVGVVVGIVIEGVRVIALGRLGGATSGYERLDRAIGIGNVVAGLLCVPAIFLFGFTIRM